MDDYDIQIEIDTDSGEITWIKDGVSREYTVEELEGKGKIDQALQAGAEITVYSQGQTYTLEEYLEYVNQDEV